ncbi:MAG: hypothetical protein FWF97_01705 [Alphaproteobacteria bacterium]|nr:hypothetical protein [Alphaproteobacteria bacterium]
MKNWFCDVRGHCRKCSAIVFAWASILLVVVMFFGAVCIYAKPHISELYATHYTVAELDETILTKKDKTNIDQLIAKNKIVPVSVIYENTLSYYNTIITILIGLLAGFAIFSWISIRSKLDGEIRKIIHEEMQSEWFGIYFDKKVADYLKTNLSDYVAEELDETRIRGFISQEYELTKNKIIEQIQKDAAATIKPKPAAKKKATTKKKGGR